MRTFSTAAWKIRKVDLSQPEITKKKKKVLKQKAMWNICGWNLEPKTWAGGLQEGGGDGRKVAPCLVIVAISGLGEDTSNRQRDGTEEVR